MFEMKLHLHRRILEQQGRWFHQDRLIRLERTHKSITGGMKQQQPGRRRRVETIHELAQRVVRLRFITASRRKPDA